MEPNPQLDELVAEIAGLRPLPGAAARVLRIADDDQFSAHELAQAIAADPALTARLLRLANSAYYGFPRRISTVRDAVVLLGFRAVRSAAVASTVMGVLTRPGSIDRHQVWRFSVTVGVLAEVIALGRGRHAEEAFTAGVLHDIGLLALDQHRPVELSEASRMTREQGLAIAEAERRVLGFTDAELGEALALHWNFPVPLAEAIGHHALEPSQLPDPDSLTAFVLRARLFARANGISDGLDRARPPAPVRVWDEPAVVEALERAGGISAVQNRVDAFVDAALTDR